jgi:hypothetical protein
MSSLEVNTANNVKRWVLIVWPAFVAACLLEVLVFSMIDPGELHWPGFLAQPSRQGIYTVAFFCFWLISMVGSGLAWWLACPDDSANSMDIV